jgi:Effector-associated domain 1
MSLFTEPFDIADRRAKELLAIAITGYSDKPPLKTMVAGVGIADVDVNWDGAVADVWPRIITVAARRNRLRELVRAFQGDPNYALVLPRIEALLDEAREEEQSETSGRAATRHTMVTVVGRRPFINRSRFRSNVESLFGSDGDRTMIVDGPRKSGRSYSWVLISYVTRMTGGPQASLIDISLFRDARVRPDDVASMIAADLGWAPAGVDETAQDETKGRLLLGWLKRSVRQHGAVCLVFDGLDGGNLANATVEFIGDIAAAAGNDELGDSRVVLLAYGRALQNPNVEPFVLREPPLTDIPLAEFTAYLQTVAAEGGQAMTDLQAQQLARALLGLPMPDPVPMSLLAARATEMSKIVCKLRRGIHG